MGTTDTWMQGLRIPLVVTLLVVTGQLMRPLFLSLGTPDTYDAWRAWVPLVLVGGAAAAVILIGRDHRHPPAILAVEAVIAGVLGFLPSVQWIVWFGFSGIVGSTFSNSTPVGFVQPLAIVWFVTATVTLVRQLRVRDEAPDQEVVG